MSLEAIAGKNPVTHVGKRYNLAAKRIAEALVAELSDVAEARCYLVSRIGRPIRDAQIAHVEVELPGGRQVAELAPSIEVTVNDNLARLDTLWQEMIGEVQS